MRDDKKRRGKLSRLGQRDQWAKRILAAMDENDMTQEEVAAELPHFWKNQNSFGMWLKRHPKPEQFAAVARLLHISPAWMMFDYGPKKPFTDKEVELMNLILNLPDAERSMLCMAASQSAIRTGETAPLRAMLAMALTHDDWEEILSCLLLKLDAIGGTEKVQVVRNLMEKVTPLALREPNGNSQRASLPKRPDSALRKR